MFTLSHTVEVNPAGTPALTREQLWHALVRKAEAANLFVPGMEECTVLERTADGLVREVVYRGKRTRQRIVFAEGREVRFLEMDAERPNLTINTISEDGGRLMLTFSFQLRFPGVPEGSPEEAAAGDKIRADYSAAVEATLRKARELTFAAA
jgi:hypothetical protein